MFLRFRPTLGHHRLNSTRADQEGLSCKIDGRTDRQTDKGVAKERERKVKVEPTTEAHRREARRGEARSEERQDGLYTPL